MPPDSSVASVRDTCAVASVRASGPKYGSRRIAACRRLRCPGCRNQSTNAADDRGDRPPKISAPLPTRFVETATTMRVDIGNAAPLADTARRTSANSGTTLKTIRPTTAIDSATSTAG